LGDDSDTDSDSDAGDDEGGRRGGDVRLDTFNEKFMSMNLDKIIHKIRELYKDGFFYKKTGPNGIISHVNAIRQYPVAQINLALTQMVSDPNEYVNDKYGRLGRVINVGDYYMFQPIEITDKRISIHERSTPVPYKHSSIEYPLPGEVTEDYLGVGLGAPGAAALASASATVNSNKKVVSKVKKAIAAAAAASEDMGADDSLPTQLSLSERNAPEASSAAALDSDSGSESGSEAEPANKVDELIITLSNTFETCKTVYDKPTKDQDEWYYYCGKVIDQISRTDEFQITKDELNELVIANLIEHLLFNDSITLVNYLYQKNNYSMMTTAVSGVAGGGAAAAISSVQPLTQFERMLLNYYSQQVIDRPLVGKRASIAAAGGGGGAAASVAKDQGMLLFHEKKEPSYALVVLRYETREWTTAEPEDERDFKLLLGELQTRHIQNMNMVIGFVSFFKKEYLIFKVKVMSKKRDKGARCDQSGKTETITTINTLLSLNAATSGDEYKLTIENTKLRTQRELCVFQEFLLRTFHRNRVNGRKWFFTPCEAILCNIEKLYLEK
jgi:hypothetical protein